jgi:hypothetical protein
MEVFDNQSSKNDNSDRRQDLWESWGWSDNKRVLTVTLMARDILLSHPVQVGL